MSDKILTYLDSGLLIALHMNSPAKRAAKVISLLANGNRGFISSDAMQIEVFPKPTFFQETFSVMVLKSFFSFCVRHVSIDQPLYQKAVAEASKIGLSGMDALHIVSAHEAGASEFITTEKETKAMYRTKLIRVRHLDSI